MITEIGALATIIKTLLDAAKSGRDLLGGGNRKSSIEAIQKTQDRLAGIADQLFQSVALSKMLPVWLKAHAAVDLYVEDLSDGDVKLLDAELRDLIYQSIHDSFSGTFFRMSFAVLPGVDAGISAFRERLTALETQLNGIPPGDAVSWRRAWPIVKVRMHDLAIEAIKLDTLADMVHAQLVTELRDAAGAR